MRKTDNRNTTKQAAFNNKQDLYTNAKGHCFKLFYSIVTIFLLFIHVNTIAQVQVYPVSVTTQLIPPYSVNLADYAAPGCEQLKVIIVQRDLTQPPYSLYLKMEISLNGRIIIQTSAQYVQPPLVLEPGLPTIISGFDLYPFFDPQNMDFIGYSRETYLRTKSLPEGAYNIKFTAYDYARREVVLSSGGSMYCYLAKTEPPALNLPFNNTGIPSTPSQYITFQWLSRNVFSANSSLSILYRFELFEMRLDGRRPDQIVQSSRPIFTSETGRTTLAYTIADPQLEVGMRYAWRVKAFDTEGRDYIRNSGYSEVFNFVYGVAENTVLPDVIIENFVAKAVSPRKAKLTWDASTGFDSYKVYYRKQGENNRWYEEETVQNSFDLNGLSSGNIYECRVQGKKNSLWGGFSNTDTVAQPLVAPIACGSPFQPLELSNMQPLRTLLRLQEVDAGGFIMTVVEAEGGNGRFTGRGYVRVPLFANVKLRCEFDNILVNTEYQLAGGAIHLITDRSDGTDNALWNIDNEFEGGTDNGIVRDGTEGVTVNLPNVIIPGAESIILDTTRQQVIVVTNAGDTIRTDVSGALNENARTITIEDEEGNLYSVDTRTGESTGIGNTQPGRAQQQVPLPTTLNSTKGVVKFDAVPGETEYSFDIRNVKYAGSNMFTGEYKTIPMTDGSLYDVPFKFIPVGETDVVLARVEDFDRSLSMDSIIFRSSTGTIYNRQQTSTEGEFLLTLPSGQANDGIDVFALYPLRNGQFDVMGKLTVMSYNSIRPKVVFVPVNGNDIDETRVKEELDKVYHPVGVDWQVSKDESFDITVGDLNINGSDMFSQYSDEMKTFNNAFIEHKGTDFDPSVVYLFILQWSGTANATGDMPRSMQFGYIFTETSDQAGAQVKYRTIAHELGHGVSRLKHTFDSDYQIPQYSTNNLMDYTSGVDIVKHQWDAIHDPGIVLGVFERDEDAASIWNGRLTILDPRHTLLFNHVYDNNNEGDLKYLLKIESSRIEDPEEESLDLDYDEAQDNEWINNWKLRTKTSDEILNNIIKKIQNAGKDEKIASMSLNEKGIYIGKYTLEDVEYPIAVYSEKATINNITKIQVTEISELTNEENKKHFKSEETFIKYLLLAFYEDGNTEPVLMMQIEKFDISERQNTKEIWLEYLNILGTEKIAPLPGDPLIKMAIVGTDGNNKANKIGGTYGCKRYTDKIEEQNCVKWSENIANFPSLSGKNKVHDGIDLRAEVETPVYAMFDGTAQILYSEDLGNYILIKSTSSEHKITTEAETIWVSYGHLSNMLSSINNTTVYQGQLIGCSGKTGTTAKGLPEWETHVHLTVYKGNTNRYSRINPTLYITTKFDSDGNKIN